MYSWHCDSFLLVSGVFLPSVSNRKAVGHGAAQGDEDGRYQDVHGVLKTEVAVTSTQVGSLISYSSPPGLVTTSILFS